MTYFNPKEDCANCDGKLGEADKSKLHCVPVMASPVLDRFGCGTGEPVGVEAWTYFCRKCTKKIPKKERRQHPKFLEDAA